MRTVIYIGLTNITYAISKETPSVNSIKVFLVILIVCAFMDIVEWFNNIKKK